MFYVSFFIPSRQYGRFGSSAYKSELYGHILTPAVQFFFIFEVVRPIKSFRSPRILFVLLRILSIRLRIFLIRVGISSFQSWILFVLLGTLFVRTRIFSILVELLPFRSRILFVLAGTESIRSWMCSILFRGRYGRFNSLP
jgi:hypothetical protein